MFQILLAIIYMAFISLGLPDSLLGAAWPNMYPEMGVPLSYAGIISAIIAVGTIISSLQSERLTIKFGAGKVTTVSVAMTALALFGFSISHNFVFLCFWAIPYGLGAGSVDAALNNYVAIHYESWHMSWLHCMWGVGASIGPYIMGYALTGGRGWNTGYRIISIMQIVLTVLLFLSLPLWKTNNSEQKTESCEGKKPMALKDLFKIRGVKEVLFCFFCYCAVEQTTGLWASSYLHLYKNLPLDTAASFASIFFIGITVGRAINGFLSLKLSDLKMVRLGQAIILLGIIVMFIPSGAIVSLIGIILIGLGCAPVFPCLIHATPAHFGEDKSQAVIGVQMAFSYCGTLVMPPLFGVIANAVDVKILPVYLLILTIVMALLHESLNRKTS